MEALLYFCLAFQILFSPNLFYTRSNIHAYSFSIMGFRSRSSSCTFFIAWTLERWFSSFYTTYSLRWSNLISNILLLFKIKYWMKDSNPRLPAIVTSRFAIKLIQYLDKYFKIFKLPELDSNQQLSP